MGSELPVISQETAKSLKPRQWWIYLALEEPRSVAQLAIEAGIAESSIRAHLRDLVRRGVVVAAFTAKYPILYERGVVITEAQEVLALRRMTSYKVASPRLVRPASYLARTSPGVTLAKGSVSLAKSDPSATAEARSPMAIKPPAFVGNHYVAGRRERTTSGCTIVKTCPCGWRSEHSGTFEPAVAAEADRAASQHMNANGIDVRGLTARDRKAAAQARLALGAVLAAAVCLVVGLFYLFARLG